MITAIVTSKVQSFDNWLPAFESHADERKKNGCTSAQVFKGLADQNDVTIVFTWSSAEALGKFMSDPEVQKKIASAGTIGKPVASLCTLAGNFES